ncbi:hypothetical protein C8Q77DRAFT_65034 [Trametes polyzona]|nr:hypothetical protein C8Q77DRAFT_65034 [Trametes polyzona]
MRPWPSPVLFFPDHHVLLPARPAMLLDRPLDSRIPIIVVKRQAEATGEPPPSSTPLISLFSVPPSPRPPLARPRFVSESPSAVCSTNILLAHLPTPAWPAQSVAFALLHAGRASPSSPAPSPPWSVWVLRSRPSLYSFFFTCPVTCTLIMASSVTDPSPSPALSSVVSTSQPATDATPGTSLESSTATVSPPPSSIVGQSTTMASTASQNQPAASVTSDLSSVSATLQPTSSPAADPSVVSTTGPTEQVSSSDTITTTVADPASTTDTAISTASQTTAAPTYVSYPR